MNEFRSALTHVVAGWPIDGDGYGSVYVTGDDARDIIDDVLHMPEMAAIRNLIHAVAMYGIGCIDSDTVLALYAELPESVIDWVHGDEVAS